MSLPAAFRSTLRLPTIAAPMFLVSGPELVIGTCRAGRTGVCDGRRLHRWGVGGVWRQLRLVI